MKLASLNQGRDGQLIVVSRDLRLAVYAHDIAPTLQFALDNWSLVEAPLQRLYQQLNDGMVTLTFPFNPNLCSSPLPRAYQWADGSAYVNHVELVRKARGAEMPESFWTDPLIYQACPIAFMLPPATFPWPMKAGASTSKGKLPSSPMMYQWGSAQKKCTATSSC